MRIELAYRTPQMLQLVEMAGRTCYRSEGKISNDSAGRFVSRIVRSGHESVIEHAHAVFSLQDIDPEVLFQVLRLNGLLTCVPTAGMYYLSGNIRMFKDLVRTCYKILGQLDAATKEFVLQLVEKFYELPQAFFIDFVEAGWMKADKFVSEGMPQPIVPQVIYEQSGQVVELLHLDPADALVEQLSLGERESLLTCTVRMRTSRDSTHQEVRHRLAAYSQESQRYVDLQNRLDYIHPSEIPADAVFAVDVSDIPDLSCRITGVDTGSGRTVTLSFDEMVRFTKACYVALRQAGFKPEVARSVLPNATATTIVVTRTLAQWRHYLVLRCDAAAQRPIRERARGILTYLQENGWLQDLVL